MTSSNTRKEIMLKDGFTLVTRGGRGGQKGTDLKQSKQMQSRNDHPVTNEVILAISNRIEELRRTLFVKKMYDTCFEILSSLKKHEFGMECYGIGRIGCDRNAQIQLAVLILLKELLDFNGTINLYEPVLLQGEKEALSHYGFTVSELNSIGKEAINSLTIFYMPHCPKALYSNILSSNFGLRLSNIIIIGNSFSSYEERALSKRERNKGPSIHRVLSVVKEETIESNEEILGEAFVDTGVHWFPPSAVKSVNEDFWKDNGEEETEDYELIQ